MLNQTRRGSNLQIIFWTTLIGGFISSLVKWGGEVNMPPRVAGEVSPPAAHLNAWGSWFGFDSHIWDYTYQGTTILGAVTAYHWALSFVGAFLYVALSMHFPRIRMWYGAMYGIIFTIIAHGILIPAMGFRHPVYADGAIGWLWNLNASEFWSEMIGHIYWSVSIEIAMIAVLAHFGRTIYGNWTK